MLRTCARAAAAARSSSHRGTIILHVCTSVNERAAENVVFKLPSASAQRTQAHMHGDGDGAPAGVDDSDDAPSIVAV
jgi:hypothetical protein